MLFNLLPLVGFFSLVWTAPQQQTSALTVREPFTPVQGGGGAVVTDSNGNTRIYIQTSTGAINVLAGQGLTTGGNYQPTEILAAGIAKVGTPIAVAASPAGTLDQVSHLHAEQINRVRSVLAGPLNEHGGRRLLPDCC